MLRALPPKNKNRKRKETNSQMIFKPHDSMLDSTSEKQNKKPGARHALDLDFLQTLAPGGGLRDRLLRFRVTAHRVLRGLAGDPQKAWTSSASAGDAGNEGIYKGSRFNFGFVCSILGLLFVFRCNLQRVLAKCTYFTLVRQHHQHRFQHPPHVQPSSPASQIEPWLPASSASSVPLRQGR